MHLRLVPFFHDLIAHLFLALSNIPLSGCTTFMIFLNTHYFSHFFYLIKIFNLFFFQLRISGMIEMVWRSSVSSDAQQCPTLCDPRDCSPPGSSVHRILLARILERVAISSSSGSSWPRDWTRVSYASCIGRWILHHQCYLGSPRRGSINKSLPNASMALQKLYYGNQSQMSQAAVTPHINSTVF